MTVAGFLPSTYGASTIAPALAPALQGWGLPPAAASATDLVSTTLVTSYLSLILGELVPKRIALQRSTGVSLLTAPALDRFATAMRPVIWFLSVSTDLVVRLAGGGPKAKGEAITHEELRDLLIGHNAILEDWRRILSEVMRPRTDADFLDAATALPLARDQALQWGLSRYPVTLSSFDDIAGSVHAARPHCAFAWSSTVCAPSGG